MAEQAVRAVRVQDAEELSLVRARFVEKYELDEDDDEGFGDAWVFRLDRR